MWHTVRSTVACCIWGHVGIVAHAPGTVVHEQLRHDYTRLRMTSPIALRAQAAYARRELQGAEVAGPHPSSSQLAPVAQPRTEEQPLRAGMGGGSAVQLITPVAHNQPRAEAQRVGLPVSIAESTSASQTDSLQRFAQLIIKDTESGKQYMLAESAMSPTSGGLSQTLVDLDTNSRRTFQYDTLPDGGTTPRVLDVESSLSNAARAAAANEVHALKGRLQPQRVMRLMPPKDWCAPCDACCDVC
jgi:hypothetical protein